MDSFPRFRRGLPATNAGTSIIAALVFAAVLGAIALSLNALQSGSANTAALPAQAATAVAVDNVQCQAGHVYYVAKQAQNNTPQGSAYDINPQNIHVSTPGSAPLTLNFTYASNYNPGKQVVVGDATANKCNFVRNPNTTTGTGSCLQVRSGGTGDSNCVSTYTVEYAGKTTRISCPNAQGSGGTGVEIYMKDTTTQVMQCQAGAKLQSTAGLTSSSSSSPPPASAPTTCSNGANNPPDCNACPNGASGFSNSTGLAICNPAPTVTADKCSNGANNPPDCNACPNGASGFSNSTGLAICNPVSTQPPSTQTPPAACLASSYDPIGCGVSQYCISNPTAAGCNGSPPSTAAPPTGACTVNGQSGTYVNGVCTPASAVVPPPGPATQGCPAGMTCTPTGQNANNSNPLSALLSGLAKGLGGSNCTPTAQNSSVGGNGTTLVPTQVMNPQTGQVTTVYVQQQTGTTATGQPCIPAQAQPQSSQQAPYGVGNNGSACPAPPQPPQCATGATPQPISATGNGCMTGYQCVPTAGSTIGQTPTPQISCSPQVADVGQSVAIAYSCTNATGSSGGGFSTNNQTSGSASATIAAPPTGTNTANFGITCTGSGQTASAQCSVQVNQPAIDLVADPQAVPAGQTSTIGWITAGMKSCIISSPDDATFTAGNAASTNINGTAPTDAITQDTHFTLTCTTLGGQTKTASTIVSVGAAPTNASVNVSSTADATTVNHGDTVTITWAASSTPAGSAIALWLIDINTEEATALIAGAQSANGTYQWQLPAAGSTCDQTSLAPCASDLVAGSSYGIEAAVYTPQNAYLGVTVPSGQVAPSYVGEGYTANPFTVGQ